MKVVKTRVILAKAGIHRCFIVFVMFCLVGCYGQMNTEAVKYGGFFLSPTEMANSYSVIKRTDGDVYTQRIIAKKCAETRDPVICEQMNGLGGWGGWDTQSPHMRSDRNFYNQSGF